MGASLTAATKVNYSRRDADLYRSTTSMLTLFVAGRWAAGSTTVSGVTTNNKMVIVPVTRDNSHPVAPGGQESGIGGRSLGDFKSVAQSPRELSEGRIEKRRKRAKWTRMGKGPCPKLTTGCRSRE